MDASYLLCSDSETVRTSGGFSRTVENDGVVLLSPDEILSVLEHLGFTRYCIVWEGQAARFDQ